MFHKDKKDESENVEVVESVDTEVATEPVGIESVGTEERVSAGKQTLGLLALIVLIAGAVTMIVNFGLGFSEESTNPENWIDLVPIILSAIISIFTYVVLCVVAMQFVKGKAKGVKITYWVSTLVAYIFILVPLIIDIVNVVKATQGN